MSDKINFQGKIKLSQGDVSSIFDKANVSLISEKISREYENIKGDSISIVKGYKYECKFELFLLNSDTTNANKLSKVLSMMSLLSIKTPMKLTLYREDGVTEAFHIDFQNVVGDLGYTDYLSGNAQIGLKFEFNLETLLLVSSYNVLSGW